MVVIKEVKTKKDINKFIEFPNILFKGVKNFVPFVSLYEKQKFNKKKNESFDDCDTQCFLAYKDGKIAGRIKAIIQHLEIKKLDEQIFRFSRFDCINDQEVANALFKAAEDWGKAKGMKKIHGPLGYNDLDREGMLVEGFDQPQTYEEQYNFDYYPKLVEGYGFKKESDWLEYRLFRPTESIDRYVRLADAVMKKYELHKKSPKKIAPYVKKYKKDVFELIHKAYSPLLGVVPLTEKVKATIIAQFKMMFDKRMLISIHDKNDKLVGFGIALPSISKSVSKSKGRFFPFGWARILWEIKHPTTIDLGLIAVDPEYQNRGLNAVVVNHIVQGWLKAPKVLACETNLMLEDNGRIQSSWENFEFIQHKRRRCYIKEI